MTCGRLALLLSAAGLGLSMLLGPVPAAEAKLHFKRCDSSTVVRCGRLTVPLDRTGTVPGRVSLFVTKVRARRRGGATRPPVVVLAGGPGQSATDAFGFALDVLDPLYRDRDLVIFDQRGTGRSGLLRCRSLERANLLKAGRAASACARSLGARRAFYTSRDSADDIDALREQLRAQHVALYGTSYGTKVALGYALRYPARVDRLVLDSVVEVDGPDPFYLDTFDAVPRALRTLCRRRCPWTSDAVADLASLVDRLARGPIRGRVIDRGGRTRIGRLTRADVFSILLGGDFDPALRAAFPGSVRAALQGDPVPLLRLRRRAFALDAEPPPPRALSTAVYAATTCEEAPLPWARSTPPDPAERHRQAEARAATILDSEFEPFDRATALASDTLNLCESWPNAPPAPEFGPGPLPDVPVLLLEGEDDLRTPMENAQRVAALFPRSSLVVAPATGHSALGSDFSGCTERAFKSFFEERPVATRCRGARRLFRPPPPPPRHLSDVSPLVGTSGPEGRTLAAVRLTLGDVAEDSITELFFDLDDPDRARGGGLRAGHYRIDGHNTLTLDGVAFVPGVTVSGRLEHFGEPRQRGRLRVSGGAAAGGVLRLRGGRVRGRLGGRPVRAGLYSRGAIRAPVAQRQHPRAIGAR